MSDWKPCPACGGSAQMDDFMQWKVVCTECSFESDCEDWNDRTVEDELLEEIGEYQKEFGCLGGV